MRHSLHLWIGCLACCMAAFCLVSCEDDETALGLALQDPSSQYVGIHDTIKSPDMTACTYYDDSLRTSGYYSAMVGYYSDAVYGRVASRSFMQLALVNNGGLDFATHHFTVDSAMLSLVIVDRYPAMTGSQTLRLRITQTAEMVSPDSVYYASSELPLSATVFLDTTFTISANDTVLRFSLNSAFRDLFSNHVFPSNTVLQQTLRGFCIECVESSSDPLMLTFDMGKSASGLSLYYQDAEGATQSGQLQVGYTSPQSESNHFCQFSHTYSGQFLQLQQGAIDSIDGVSQLYLEPLGGTAVCINIDSYVRRFHAAHPRAVIHYAELLLPVNAAADDAKPSRIVAYRRYATGSTIFVNDYLSDNAGYDGYYDEAKGLYRLRITHHLQGLMMAGADYGTLLMLDGRRSSACRTILNGTQSTDAVRIAFVYSE